MITALAIADGIKVIAKVGDKPKRRIHVPPDSSVGDLAAVVGASRLRCYLIDRQARSLSRTTRLVEHGIYYFW